MSRYFCGKWLCTLLFLFVHALSIAQVVDTAACEQLLELEVVSSLKPSSLVASSPLQVMEQGDFLRTGSLSLSDAVKRMTGVDVHDYGGVGGLKTVSVRGLGAKHTAVSYDGVVLADVLFG